MSEDYLCGYGATEFSRLEEQHRIWQGHTREHFCAANLNHDDVVLDVGCGPGFVSADLAAQGISVLATDRHQASLDSLAARCQRERLSNIHIYPASDVLAMPALHERPTVAYMRWILCFLGSTKTEALIRKLPLRTGGRILVHDFINYRSARLEPFSPAVQSTIEMLFQKMADADIGFELPGILIRSGFRVTWKRVVPMAIAPTDPEWLWPDQFFKLHVPSLGDSIAFFQDWNAAAHNPAALFYSWPVLQLVAVKQ
jgi:SAM-dependent methyltransferase